MCILALSIGIFSYKNLSTTSFRGNWFYSLVFGAYGIMMTIAMFQHTMIPRSSIFYSIFWLFNSSLTSCIAMGYFWAGLADAKILDFQSMTFKVCAFGSFAGIASGWAYTILTNHTFLGFLLYFVLISLTCFVFLICQIYFLYQAGEWTGTANLGVAGVAGILGILSLLMGKWICDLLGFLAPFLTPNFFWYLWSDVAVFFLFLYVIQTSRFRIQEEMEVLPIFGQHLQQHHVYQTNPYDSRPNLANQNQIYQLDI